MFVARIHFRVNRFTHSLLWMALACIAVLSLILVEAAAAHPGQSPTWAGHRPDDHGAPTVKVDGLDWIGFD